MENGAFSNISPWGLFIAGCLDLIAATGAGLLFGSSVLDVVALKDGDLAPFVIVGYVLMGAALWSWAMRLKRKRANQPR